MLLPQRTSQRRLQPKLLLQKAKVVTPGRTGRVTPKGRRKRRMSQKSLLPH